MNSRFGENLPLNGTFVHLYGHWNLTEFPESVLGVMMVHLALAEGT